MCVESVADDDADIVVINPDTRAAFDCPRDEERACTCFQDGVCGRMRIPRSALGKVCLGALVW